MGGERKKRAVVSDAYQRQVEEIPRSEAPFSRVAAPPYFSLVFWYAHTAPVLAFQQAMTGHQARAN